MTNQHSTVQTFPVQLLVLRSFVKIIVTHLSRLINQETPPQSNSFFALQFENFMVENYAFQDGKLMDRWINVLVNAIAVVPFVVR